MKLSIVIVNYNVRYFLEQCLHAVERATKNIRAEVFVVDNNSVDGSCFMVKEKFPEVKLIENRKNHGFSYANNQAIRIARGEYILLLNPDTIVEEDTFTKTINYLDNHTNVGALGVKMIDGKGNFLPESKRGLPTPWVAFYKVFGFSKLFPRSKKFGQYHLSYLNEDEIHEIDILSGAFMLMRKQALDKAGLLDEDYFMYGEDIDLSYRIQQKGYTICYFPEAAIIHYKGESTKKGSINYVRIFYNAMIIFARKHFAHKGAGIFILLIHIAIYLRALLAIVKRFVSRIFYPLADFIIGLSGFFLIIPYWEKFRYEAGYYPDLFLQVVVPVYILIWIFCTWLSGGYDRPVRLKNLYKGVTGGTLFILLAYSLLPDSLRFSRAMILLGGTWAFITLPVLRLLLDKVPFLPFSLHRNTDKKIAIIGDSQEAERVKALLEQAALQFSYAGTIHPDKEDAGDDLGNLRQINEIIAVHKIEELIFCSKNIPAGDIIQTMLKLSSTKINFKIAPTDAVSVIGSNSIDTAGDLYVIDMNAMTIPVNRRSKRLLDLLLALLFLILWPISILWVPSPGNFLLNSWKVLTGQRSWTGFDKLPRFQQTDTRNGIICPSDKFSIELTREQKLRLNLNFAKDYSIWKDLQLIFSGYKKLGRRTL